MNTFFDFFGQHSKLRFKQIVLFLSAILFTSIALAFQSHIEPAEGNARPSLIYKPMSNNRPPKYPMRVGVFPIQDGRLGLFHAGRDDFYQEPVIEGLSRMLAFELSYSRLFGDVKVIQQAFPEKPSLQQIAALGRDHQVDLIFVADVTVFNFVRTILNMRAKAIGPPAADFENAIKFSMIGQLIDPGTGLILFAEKVDREYSELGEDGTLSSSQLASLTEKTLREGFADLKTLLNQTGATLKVAR